MKHAPWIILSVGVVGAALLIGASNWGAVHITHSVAEFCATAGLASREAHQREPGPIMAMPRLELSPNAKAHIMWKGEPAKSPPKP